MPSLRDNPDTLRRWTILLRMLITSALFSVCFVGCSAYGSGTYDDDGLTPIAPDTAGQRMYVPKDLDECMTVLDSLLPPSVIDTIRHSTLDDMIDYHIGLGMWLRNNWGLWRGLRLYQYFWSYGVRHPDDMSGIILNEYWYHLQGERHTVEEAIERHRKHTQEIINRGVGRTNERDDAFSMVFLFGLAVALLYSFL